MRRANLSAIVRELHLRGPLSRSELVAADGPDAKRDPRPHRRARRRPTSSSEEAAVPSGSPGRPSPLVRLASERVVVLALEIAVDSLAVAVVGARRRRSSRTAASIDPVATAPWTTIVARSRSDSSDGPGARRPAGEVPLGVGVAVAGHGRPVRRARPLRPEPRLARRSARRAPRRKRWSSTMPVAVANEADLGALAELRRGAARGADDVLYVHGEVGVGGGIIVDGRPLDGSRRLRRRGRPHAGQPGRDAVPLRLDRLLGDRGRRARAACACGLPARRWPRRPSTPCSPTRRQGDRQARPRPRRGRSLARHRPGRARQRPQPAAHRAGRPVLRIYPFVGRHRRWRARPLAPSPRHGGRCGRAVRRSASTRRCSAPPSCAFEPFLVGSGRVARVQAVARAAGQRLMRPSAGRRSPVGSVARPDCASRAELAWKWSRRVLAYERSASKSSGWHDPFGWRRRIVMFVRKVAVLTAAAAMVLRPVRAPARTTAAERCASGARAAPSASRGTTSSSRAGRRPTSRPSRRPSRTPAARTSTPTPTSAPSSS